LNYCIVPLSRALLPWCFRRQIHPHYLFPIFKSNSATRIAFDRLAAQTLVDPTCNKKI
jgi:hypothetical protein